MKVKSSFITNSSSASFIISTPKGFTNPIKIKLEIQVDLYELNDKSATNKEDLWKLLEYCGYEDMFEELNFEIEQGRDIHILQADSNDENPAIMLISRSGLKEHLVNKDEIKVIMGEGGY